LVIIPIVWAFVTSFFTSFPAPFFSVITGFIVAFLMFPIPMRVTWRVLMSMFFSAPFLAFLSVWTVTLLSTSVILGVLPSTVASLDMTIISVTIVMPVIPPISSIRSNHRPGSSTCNAYKCSLR
jgi:hypothetical protein